MRPVSTARAAGSRWALLLWLGGACGVDPVASAGPDPAEVDLVDVVAGDEHSCALNRDGRAWCWGQGKAGRTNTTETVTSIAAGAYHTCGLAEGGRPHCWGQRYWSTPADSGFVELCAGRDFACGRDEAGAVRCWGGSHEPGPPKAPFAVPVQRLVCGSYGVCGLDRDGEVVCWHAEVSEGFTPVPASVVEFDVGSHACGVTGSGELVCWAADDDDPEANPPPGEFSTVGVGYRFSCALTLAGAVRCWGEDQWAVLDAPPGRFTRLAVGRSHACALREDGRVLCWGQSQDCVWHGELLEDCAEIPASIGEVFATASFP